MESPIPSQELTHNSQKVFFAFRTMEENYLRTGGKPDVPHRHEFFTVLLVRNACGKHFVDYEEFEMKPGMVFLLDPGQVHQVITESLPDGDIIMFNEEFLHLNYVSYEFISNIGLFSCGTSVPPLSVGKEGAKKLSAYSAEIRDALESGSPFKFDMVASYLKLFLIECNQYAVPSKEKNPQAIEAGRPIVRSFKELLEKKYSQWHQVNMYAMQLNITPDYLNNVIKSGIGKTAKELIAQRIIMESKRLGLHTSLSLKEIAFALGFDDPSHFSKFYKNETGQPFSEFRASIKLIIEN